PRRPRARRGRLRRRGHRARPPHARRRLRAEDRPPSGRRRRAGPGARGGRVIAEPTFALARRALRGAARRPQFLAPLVIFPSLFLAINTGGLHRSTDLPGFPHVSGFFDFQLAGAMTQSLLLGGVSAGIATALEIEGGFFDRLVA